MIRLPIPLSPRVIPSASVLLFYGYLADGSIIFASEAKNLVGLCAHVFPFPPGHYYKDGKFVRYADLTTVTRYSDDDLDTVTKKIREKLISAVEKRLDADAPLGFLLSGGLDSSLVCAISAKLLGKKIRTFAIGMDLDRHRPQICEGNC